MPAQGWYWNKNLVKFESVRTFDSPSGILLKRRPVMKSQTVRTISSRRSVTVMGYIETDGIRFYVSDLAWQDYRRKRLKPLFVYIVPNANIEIHREVSGIKLTEFETDRVINTTYGFYVKKSPYLSSANIQFVDKAADGSSSFLAKGFVDTVQGRFYISKWSWEQLMKGGSPNWILLAEKPGAKRNVIESEQVVVTKSLQTTQSREWDSSEAYKPSGQLTEAQVNALWEIASLCFGVKVIDYLTQYSDAETRAFALTAAKKIRNPLIDDCLKVLVPGATSNGILNTRIFLVSVVDGNTSALGLTESAVKAHLIKSAGEKDENLRRLVYWTIAIIDFNKAYAKASSR